MNQKTLFVLSWMMAWGCTAEKPSTFEGVPPADVRMVAALSTLKDAQNRCILKPEDVARLLTDRADPPNVMTRLGFDSTRKVHVPSPNALRTPHWEGDVLYVDCVTYLPNNTFSDYLGAHRYRFTFNGATPERTEQTLELTPLVPTRAIATVNEMFGGSVDGFVQIRNTHFAVGGTPETARVLRNTSAGVQKLLTFEDFAKTGALDHPAEMERFVNELNQIMSAQSGGQYSGFKAIGDAEAYKTEYRQKGSNIFKLRYQYDKIKETHYSVTDWDNIRNPRVENGRLIAFFRDYQDQPHRLEADIDNLAWGSALKMVPMFTEEVVSDSGGPPAPPQTP